LQVAALNQSVTYFRKPPSGAFVVFEHRGLIHLSQEATNLFEHASSIQNKVFVVNFEISGQQRPVTPAGAHCVRPFSRLLRG
jgi:hypothetical protein